jgi:hypothetical protein
LLASVLLVPALFGAAATLASDNDEKPPYMIYIDPETGKYTTRDPYAEPAAESRPSQPEPARVSVQPRKEFPVAGAAAIAGLLLAIGIGFLLRKRAPAGKR